MQLRPFQSLRPYGFAAAWLLVLEVVLRLTCPPDARVLRAPLPVYGCAADDELERLVSARAAGEPAVDVVLVGDSVLGSVNNPPGERLADALGPALFHALGERRPVRAFNLSVGGARAADVYGMLRRLSTRLRSAAAPQRRSASQGEDDLVVVASSNVIFFSRRHSQPPMLFPCLLDDLPAADPLRQRLSLPPTAHAVERQLSQWLAEHVYLYQQRRRLAEAIFGGPPRPALREHLQRLLHGPPGSAHALAVQNYAQYAPNYDFIPLASSEAVNHQVTEEMARWLARESGLRVLVVMTPHNHARLGAITDTAAYRGLAAAVAGTFQRTGVPFASYDRDPAMTAELFLDLDHLTAAGNRALAERLAHDLAALLRQEARAGVR